MNFFHPKRDCHLLGLFFPRYNLFDLNTVISLRVEMKEIIYIYIPELAFQKCHLNEVRLSIPMQKWWDRLYMQLLLSS